MRILITADLHYDIPRSRQPARELAERACAMSGDALVLVGDTAGADLQPWRECLGLFRGFAGCKFIVAGNHCLWCRPEESSLERYRTVLPRVVTKSGFQLLDEAPAILGGVALVGSVGWYDYSFRDESLGIPEDFYRAKVAPGAAAYLGGHEALLAAHRDALTETHMRLAAQWMDGVHVRLGISDEEFLDLIVRRLARHLAEASKRAERIVAFVHHLPFADLVPKDRPPRFAFAAAYLGAGRIGDLLQQCRKVTDVYCGHSHWPAEHTLGHLRVVNVGSTYTHKALKVLEV